MEALDDLAWRICYLSVSHIHMLASPRATREKAGMRTETATPHMRRSQLSLCSAAYALSVQHASDNVNEHRILAVTSVGLPTNLLLGYFCWIVVRHRTLRT